MFSPQPWLIKHFGIHDTCGVSSLHGIPGILSAFSSAIIAAIAVDNQYKDRYFKFVVYTLLLSLTNSVLYLPFIKTKVHEYIFGVILMKVTLMIMTVTRITIIHNNNNNDNNKQLWLIKVTVMVMICVTPIAIVILITMKIMIIIMAMIITITMTTVIMLLMKCNICMVMVAIVLVNIIVIIIWWYITAMTCIYSSLSHHDLCCE